MSESVEYRPIRIRLSMRTDYIFYPIDSNEFAKYIEKYGYEIKQPPQQVSGIVLELAGKLAEKEGNIISLDTNRQILGVDGDDPQKVIEIFNELEKIIKDDMGIDFSSSIKFYEAILDYHIYSSNNPRLRVESKMSGEFDSVFSEIVGKELSPYTIRYATKGISPDSVEWLDFRIEPFVRRADKIYAFNMVHRSQDGDDVKSTMETILDKINGIVNTLES